MASLESRRDGLSGRWTRLVALLGPFLLAATAAPVCLTWLTAREHGWEVFAPRLVWITLGEEVVRAWCIVLAAAVPIALDLAWRRRPGTLWLVWSSAWLALWSPLFLGLQRDWRLWRRRWEHDVPLLLWSRERLWIWGVCAGALLVAALVATVIARRAAKRHEPQGARAPRRRPVRLGLATAALAGLGALGGLAVERATRAVVGRGHSVLYVTFDSVRADHVSAYGYERNTTPNVDALAAQGVLFERAYSQHNWTRPSYASILTSQPRWGRAELGLLERDQTLAEELRAAGYRTAALIQNPNISGFYGFGQGFQRFVEYRGHTDEIVARAQELCAELADGEGPFFLWVHLNDAHWPYRDDVVLASGFTSEPVPPLSEKDTDRLMRRQVTPHELARELGLDGLDQRIVDWLFAGYDAEIRTVDAGLGKILATLDASGRADDTLVVLNADHGDEFYERSTFGHGHPNVYPELTHVPWVLRFPSAANVATGAPVRFADPVESVDLFPTLLGALGIEPRAALGGRDLFPYLRQASAPDPAFLTRSYNNQRLALRDSLHALHLDQRKGVRRFYDLATDPAELEAIEPEPGEPWSERFVESAERWSSAELERERRRSRGPAPDADLAEELRRLGYL